MGLATLRGLTSLSAAHKLLCAFPSSCPSAVPYGGRRVELPLRFEFLLPFDRTASYCKGFPSWPNYLLRRIFRQQDPSPCAPRPERWWTAVTVWPEEAVQQLASLELTRHDLVQAVHSALSACQKSSSDAAHLLLCAVVADLADLDERLLDARSFQDMVH